MNGNRTYRLICIAAVVFGVSLSAAAQDFDYDSLLQRIDTIENPVYKPVLSLGYGTLNFMGDVQNSYRLPVVGSPAAQVNVTTFIDNGHNFSANFFFLFGNMSGEQTMNNENPLNLNFSTNIFGIGVQVSYDFANVIPASFPLRPYLGLGVEQLSFSSKGDLYDADGVFYHYWPDGTIRSIGTDEIGAALPLTRDYVYETDLRSFERNNYSLGQYNNRTIAIPAEVGFRFDLSERIFLTVGSSLHYTFSDYIDNVASEGTHVVGKKGNDSFLFTQFTVHFDMFSDPTTRTEELLFADIELDPVFFDDEDGDFVLDIADRCPGTPYGVVTDTLGCPLDGDQDGVPDYLDKEPETPAGNWVDSDGVTLSEDDFLTMLARGGALKRSDLAAYMARFEKSFKSKRVSELPPKYKILDRDGDGYISFDELLMTIDDYFDFKVDLSLEDLRRLNEFFFEQ